MQTHTHIYTHNTNNYHLSYLEEELYNSNATLAVYKVHQQYTAHIRSILTRCASLWAIHLLLLKLLLFIRSNYFEIINKEQSITAFNTELPSAPESIQLMGVDVQFLYTMK